MNALWIVPGFASDAQDTTCLPYLQALALELLRQGTQLDVIALEYPFRSSPYHWHSARIHPCNGRNSPWRKPITLLRALRRARALLREKPYIAAHSFWLNWPAWVGQKLEKQTGLPHYCTLMGQDVLPANGRNLRRWHLEQRHRLVALSETHRNVFCQTMGWSPGHLIPFGMDTLSTKPLPWSERPLDVVGVGSLIPLKNWEKWLETLALAAKTRPNLQAILIGGGPLKKHLEYLATQWGLASHLSIIGEQPRTYVLEQMARAKVLLHTSDYESFGFIFPEAAASGCKIVSTPVGASEEHGALCAMTAAELADLVEQCLGTAIGVTPKPPSMESTATAYRQLWG